MSKNLQKPTQKNRTKQTISLIFSPSAYRADPIVCDLSNRWGVSGRYFLLEAWGFIIRQPDWWSFSAKIPTLAMADALIFRQTDPPDVREEAIFEIVDRLELLRPGTIWRESQNPSFTILYPKIYDFIGRYGQLIVAERFGLPVRPQDLVPTTWAEMEPLLCSLLGIPEYSQKIALDRIGSDQSSRSEEGRVKKREGAILSGPPLIDLFCKLVIPNARWGKRKQEIEERAVWGLVGQYGDEFVRAQIAALADPANWWAGKIKTPHMMAAKIRDGHDFVERLEEERRKHKRLPTGTQHSASVPTGASPFQKEPKIAQEGRTAKQDTQGAVPSPENPTTPGGGPNSTQNGGLHA